MLGSNPSADSGSKTDAGCQRGTPFRILPLSLRISTKCPSLGIGIKAINPGGLGAGSQIYTHLKPGIPEKRNPRPMGGVKGTGYAGPEWVWPKAAHRCHLL
jgi:hypothetical protein